MDSQQTKRKTRKGGGRKTTGASAVPVEKKKQILNIHQIKVLERMKQKMKEEEEKNAKRRALHLSTSQPTSSTNSNSDIGATRNDRRKRKACLSEDSFNNASTTLPLLRSTRYARNTNKNKVNPKPKSNDTSVQVSSIQCKNSVSTANDRKKSSSQSQTPPSNNKRRRINQAEKRIKKLRRSLETENIETRLLLDVQKKKSKTESFETKKGKLNSFVIPRKRDHKNSLSSEKGCGNYQVLCSANGNSSQSSNMKCDIFENTTINTHTPAMADDCFKDNDLDDNNKRIDHMTECNNRLGRNTNHVKVLQRRDETGNVVPSLAESIHKDVDMVKKDTEFPTLTPLESNNLRICKDSSSLKRKSEDLSVRWSDTTSNAHLKDAVKESSIAKKISNKAERRLQRLRNSLVLEKRPVMTEEISSRSLLTEIPSKRLKNDDSLDGSCTNTSSQHHSLKQFIIDEDMEKELDTSGVSVSCLENNKSFATIPSPYEEQMDFETSQTEIKEIKTILSSVNEDQLLGTNSSQKKIIAIVVDTNILLRYLQTIHNIITGDNDSIQVTIPYVVFNELDKLKSSYKSSSQIDVKARKAIQFLYKHLTDNKLYGQSLSLANNHLYPCEAADDEILNCCLQFQKNFEVILLSDDINLCNKALVNNVTVSTHTKFLSLYWDQLNIKAPKENAPPLHNNTKVKCNLKEGDNGYYIVRCEKIEKQLVEDLSIILKAEMEKRFYELWTKVVFIQPPWTLKDLLNCYQKHWMAVLSEMLPGDVRNIITNIKFLNNSSNKLESTKLVDMYTYSKRLYQCLLLTDYKYLAEKSLPFLERVLGTNYTEFIILEKQPLNIKSDKNNLTEVSKPDSSVSIPSSNVTNALKCIIESLGKYCCNLSNNLGIQHNLNINIDQPLPLESLVPQADSVGNQLEILILCLTELLALQPDSVTLSATRIKLSSTLDSVLIVIRDTLQGIGRTDVTPNIDELRRAFLTERSIFSDGCNSLSVLHQLMLECSTQYALLKNTTSS